MDNLEFDKDMFDKSNGRKDFFRYIPGFRSNKMIKKIIASIYYMFCILTMFMATSIGDIFSSISMIINFVVVCGIIDLFFKKECRNMKSIGTNIVLPFIGIIICSFIFTSNSYIYDAQNQAAKELGISLSEYEDVINKYNNILENYNELEESKKSNELDYENMQKEYDSLVNEFKEYKQLIPESSVKELETLKASNEDYKNKISDLENKISELEGKLK